MPKPGERIDYRTPIGAFISKQKQTERLYRLEEKRNVTIKEATEELQKVLGFTDFWREALPEALLSILENYDRKASYLAAKVYLEKHPEGMGHGT